MIEVVDVFDGDVPLVSGAVLRQMRISSDGAVTAQIRAPLNARDPFPDAAARRAMLRLRLGDGRTVEFRTLRPAGADGGWARLNGQIV